MEILFLLTKKNISIPLYKDQKIISQSRGMFPNLNLKLLSKSIIGQIFQQFYGIGKVVSVKKYFRRFENRYLS